MGRVFMTITGMQREKFQVSDKKTNYYHAYFIRLERQQ